MHGARRPGAPGTTVTSPAGGQPGRPRGPVGWLLGRIMARENEPMNAFAVELLEVGEHDRVLEIGFGPGRALARAAALAREGLVAGIDHSATMVREARRHNRAAVASGRVRPLLGTVSALPFPDASFDKALAINNEQFWPDRPRDLAEIARVLVPDGRLVLAVRTCVPARPTRYDGISRTQEELDDLRRDLDGAGFELARETTGALSNVNAAGLVTHRRRP